MIRASAIRSQLVTALDHWVYVKGSLSDPTAEPVRIVAQLADDDAWRVLFNAMPVDDARARVRVEGDAVLALPLLRARSVIV